MPDILAQNCDKKDDYFSRFITDLPHKPYCSDDLASGLIIRKKVIALGKRYIQHNNPATISLLTFDIDRPDAATAWLDAYLPAPTFIIQNIENGFCHVSYGIITPVARTDQARQAPLRYLASIQAAYTKAFNADRGYCGLVMKNPIHNHWRTMTPALGTKNDGYYEMTELADYVDLPDKLPQGLEAVGLGRNCNLFDSLSKWSYSAIRDYWGPGGYKAWLECVTVQAEQFNIFDTPLPYSEIRSTAKSVAKWTWANITPVGFRDLIARTHTSEIQAVRGKKGGTKSGQVRAEKADNKAIQARELSASGMTQNNIANSLNVTPRTVRNWLANK